MSKKEEAIEKGYNRHDLYIYHLKCPVCSSPLHGNTVEASDPFVAHAPNSSIPPAYRQSGSRALMMHTCAECGNILFFRPPPGK
jgi:hypothetical protein